MYFLNVSVITVFQNRLWAMDIRRISARIWGLIEILLLRIWVIRRIVIRRLWVVDIIVIIVGIICGSSQFVYLTLSYYKKEWEIGKQSEFIESVRVYHLDILIIWYLKKNYFVLIIAGLFRIIGSKISQQLVNISLKFFDNFVSLLFGFPYCRVTNIIGILIPK